MAKMEVNLQYRPGCSYVVTVDTSKVLDAGIIKYNDEFYVFDSRKSSPFEPFFVKTAVYEVPAKKSQTRRVSNG